MKITKIDCDQNKYRELPNEEKDKKREYGRNRYQNLCEENKQ